MSRQLFLLGQSGLAREMVELLAVCDPDARWRFAGMLSATEQSRVLDEVCDVLLAMGHPQIRRAVGAALSAVSAVRWPTLVHPRSDVSPSASLGAGTVIASGALISTAAQVGAHCLVNYGATVGHDAVIGDFSVVNPNASVSGGVLIGEACLVGAGATILENVTIGKGVVIGAGAVVLKDVPPGQTVVGVPAHAARIDGEDQ